MKFDELTKTENACGVVIVALAFDPTKKGELIDQMNEIFTEDGLLENGAKVIDVEKIEGNLLGDEGRTDVYIRLDKFEVSPMVRISKWQDVKWIEDFVTNCASDYVEEA